MSAAKLTYLAVRIREEDRQLLEKAARADRTTLSGWVRSAALRQARALWERAGSASAEA